MCFADALSAKTRELLDSVVSDFLIVERTKSPHGAKVGSPHYENNF
jgi:hypothetical protein